LRVLLVHYNIDSSSFMCAVDLHQSLLTHVKGISQLHSLSSDVSCSFYAIPVLSEYCVLFSRCLSILCLSFRFLSLCFISYHVSFAHYS